ncbi:MAG: hypothetical protein ISS79_13565 [Phycisphaerae bacterium]|nr:hypothetical protein [Phycisphaerae bacterium]
MAYTTIIARSLGNGRTKGKPKKCTVHLNYPQEMIKWLREVVGRMNNLETPAKQLISTIYGMGEGNPDNTQAVIIDDCVTVHLLTIGDSNNDVGIKWIAAFEEGKGHGSSVLDKIVEIADKLAVNLWVDIGWLRHQWILNSSICGLWGWPSRPESAAERGVRLERLIAWYERYGFCEDGNSGLWARRSGA